MKMGTFVIAGALLAAIAVPAHAEDEEDDQQFGAAVIIIELTDNDIELQTFVDGFEWTRLKIRDPKGRKMFEARASGRLRRQDGMSEMFWASEPTHYLEDEPNFDGTVESFLDQFPEGVYEFDGRLFNGGEIEGEARLTHVLAALPEIASPVSDTDEPPVIDRNNLVIDWEPVTTRFIGNGPIEIFEYQVIIDQVDPEREMAWVDGDTRRGLINVPPTVTSLSVPPEFLTPGAGYEFEILAIEASGNSSISVGEFVVGE